MPLNFCYWPLLYFCEYALLYYSDQNTDSLFAPVCGNLDSSFAGNFCKEYITFSTEIQAKFLLRIWFIIAQWMREFLKDSQNGFITSNVVLLYESIYSFCIDSR